MNFLVGTYAYADGGVAVDPSVPLEAADLSSDLVALAFVRSLDVGGRAAKVNVVLPYAWTGGSARFAGALRVDDFLKHVHVVSVDDAALDEVADHVVALATYEGLDAHARSVRLRQDRS